MSYIDPSSLALGTSPSPSYASPSPSPSSPSHDLPSTSSQPPRKRSRTELSSEERKEARAHRNRIAAQNSRDRRKAQFTYLERRVHDLEEENRRLRAGIPMPLPPTPMNVPPSLASLNLPSLASLASVAASAAAGLPMRTAEEELRMRQDQERERENEELKERIKTLERGWDAVVKALAAQGLPTGLSTTSTTDSSPHTSNNAPSTSPTTTKTTPSPTNNITLTPPSSTPTSTGFPNSNTLSLIGFTALPSPAPSHSSIDVNELDVSSVPSSTPFALQPSVHTRQQQEATASSPLASGPASDSVSVSSIDKNSTRHLARVASIEPLGLMALQRSSKTGLGRASAYLPSPSVTDDDDFGCDEDAKMEDLFREIFDETTTSATKDETSDRAGVQETSTAASVLWGGDASQAQVAGQGKVVGGDGLAVEGPQGAGLVEGGERQVESEAGSIVGEKRKREDDDDEEQQQVQTTMSDEDVQRMLNDIEVSMMMGNFDSSIPLAADNFNNLDMSLLGFGEPPFMDFAPGPDFGGMWTSNSAATGVF